MDLFIGNHSPRTSYIDLAIHIAILREDLRLRFLDNQASAGSNSRYTAAPRKPDQPTQHAFQRVNGEVLPSNASLSRNYLRCYGELSSIDNSRAALGR